jgi:hypothetical protein
VVNILIIKNNTKMTSKKKLQEYNLKYRDYKSFKQMEYNFRKRKEIDKEEAQKAVKLLTNRLIDTKAIKKCLIGIIKRNKNYPALKAEKVNKAKQ